MAIFKTLLLFLLLCVYISISSASNHEHCTTQENLTGKCVLLENCPSLLRMKNTVPYTARQERYLKKAMCGFEDEVYAKVCCAVVENNIAPKNTQVYTRAKPKDVTIPQDLRDCGQIADYRIAGGNVSELGDYPWMALLEYRASPKKKFCGGALINERYVLTAAHCVTPDLLSVRLGEYNLTNQKDCIDTPDGPLCSIPEDIGIEEKIVHENYNSATRNQYHDIALLRLARNVTYSDFIKPICIPTGKDLLDIDFTNATMIVAGWGFTENGTRSNVQLYTKITVKPQRECTSFYRISRSIGVGQFCAGGDDGRDACNGDSGGPVIVMQYVGSDINYYIAGVVSSGPGICGIHNWPGIYTNVLKYVPWIADKLKA